MNWFTLRIGKDRNFDARPLEGMATDPIPSTKSVAELDIEHVPALGAGSLRNGLDRMFIRNPREAVSVDLPAARRGAVGRQELRLGLGCCMTVDGVVLGVNHWARIRPGPPSRRPA